MIAQREPLPSYGPYTIEPQVTEILQGLIAEHRPKRILELGSGLSTIVMAYALEQNGSGTVTSLEESSQHAEITRGHIAKHKLDSVATVLHAPIRNSVVEWDGMVYPWYHLDRLPRGVQFDFVFVDGPVGAGAIMARWPAYYLLRPWLTHDVRLLVDDASRQAERIMLHHWLKYDEQLKRSDFPTTRGCVLLERKEYAEENVQAVG